MEPVFSAVAGNAHHLFTLLQCIGFAARASVQITPDGVRFSVDDGRVIQGLAFLDKALFTSYTFNDPSSTTANRNAPNDNNDEDGDSASDTISYPNFVISLSALLETLKIFGISDSATGPGSSSSSSRAMSLQPHNPGGPINAFTTPALLLNRSCTLQYLRPGSPLSITLSEAGVKTTCELTTYEPEDGTSGGFDLDIPLQRDAIVLKIIMRSAWLHNAITELDATNPTVLKLSASATRAPFFALSGAGGPFSESTVEFSVDQHHHVANNTTAATVPASSSLSTAAFLDTDSTDRTRTQTHPKRSKLAPTVTETFLVRPPSGSSRIRQNYRFALIRKAMRAMAAASKVSIRGDSQGVLSLQFMIDLDEGNNTTAGGVAKPPGALMLGTKVSFVDFRFVPLIDDEEVDDEEVDGEEDERGPEGFE